MNYFIHKNGNRRYKLLVLGCEGFHIVKEHSDSKNKYTEDDIINMLQFLVDNIFNVFGGKVFQQRVGIPNTNCAPLLADIFLYSYEAKFIHSLLSTGKKKLASQFKFTYRYIDDVLSINNPDFENYLGQMYPAELEIKDTTESNTSASYLDLLLSIGRDCQMRTSFTTISTSISRTVRSWVAIFHHRQPMAFLSRNSYGMPGLAPLIIVLLQGRRDFHISSSDRDMSGNIWNRPSGSFMADIRISSNIMRSSSPKFYMTFLDMTIYSHTLNWYDITPIWYLLPNLTLLPILTLSPNFGRFP